MPYIATNMLILLIKQITTSVCFLLCCVWLRVNLHRDTSSVYNMIVYDLEQLRGFKTLYNWAEYQVVLDLFNISLPLFLITFLP